MNEPEAMRTFGLWLCVLFVLSWAGCDVMHPATHSAADESKTALRDSSNAEYRSNAKVAYVILDGISADVLEQVATPNLDAIAAAGGYARATTGGEAGGYSQSPTASAIGYANVLTGTWANKHNVYTNAIRAPRYNYWSLFRLVKEQQPERVTAIYSSWIDNRTKLIGEGLPEAGDVSIDIVRDGYDVDTDSFPHDSAWVRGVDNHVARLAAESILSHGPDLSWVYLWYPDDTGHLYGDSEPYRESIRNADEQMGWIWESIRRRINERGEDWLVVVTTDHGRALPSGTGHGGQTPRERTVWFVTNSGELNGRFASTVRLDSIGNRAQAGPILHGQGVREWAMAYELQHTDLYPSVAHHLGIEIPEHIAAELDGAPFVGPVSVSGVEASLDASAALHVKWTPWQADGGHENNAGTGSIPMAQILAAFTDSATLGISDTYHQLAEVPLGNAEIRLNLLEAMPDSLRAEREQVRSALEGREELTIKIRVQGPHNGHNHWVILKRDTLISRLLGQSPQGQSPEGQSAR